MKEFQTTLIQKSLTQGLRRHQTFQRNEDALFDLYNLEPTEFGIKIHEIITDLNANSITWGGLGSKAAPTLSRTITINVQDYLTDTDLQTVVVWIDEVNKGTTDVNGELSVAGVTVGGHTLKLTKATYLDSDADDLLNDYFVVA